jgi:hypothetical protein
LFVACAGHAYVVGKEGHTRTGDVALPQAGSCRTRHCWTRWWHQCNQISLQRPIQGGGGGGWGQHTQGQGSKEAKRCRGSGCLWPPTGDGSPKPAPAIIAPHTARTRKMHAYHTITMPGREGEVSGTNPAALGGGPPAPCGVRQTPLQAQPHTKATHTGRTYLRSWRPQAQRTSLTERTGGQG